MVENLKTNKFKNGEVIPNIPNLAEWSGATFAAWCNYNNSANGVKYGHLYNWYAVNDIRKIAPVDWHIPSDSEWSTQYLSIEWNKSFLGNCWHLSGLDFKQEFKHFKCGSLIRCIND